jgi:hypothetical protein
MCAGQLRSLGSGWVREGDHAIGAARVMVLSSMDFDNGAVMGFRCIAVLAISYWSIDLDQEHSSYVFLAALALILLTAGFLFQIGIAGRALRVLQTVMQWSIRRGFQLWEQLFAWATWPVFLALAFGFLTAGWVFGAFVPALKVFCGFAPLFMGTTACLAYMFIDLERYEVERGYKATHSPLKGQALAMHLAEFGHQVHVPLLVAATLAPTLPAWR